MAEHCDHKFIDSSYCAKCGVHVDQLRGGQRWLATPTPRNVCARCGGRATPASIARTMSCEECGALWQRKHDAIGGAVLSGERPAAGVLRGSLARVLREDAWARAARGEITSKGLLVALRLAEYAPGPLPGVAELAAATGLSETQAGEGLRELEQREMIRRRDGVTAHTPEGR